MRRDLTPEQRAAIARNIRVAKGMRSTRYVLIGSDSGGYVYTFNRESGERIREVCHGGRPQSWHAADGGVVVEFSDAVLATCRSHGQPAPLWVEVRLIDGRVLDRILGREVAA